MSTTAMPNSRQKNNRDKGRGHIANRSGYGNSNSHRKDGPDNETSSVSAAPVSGVYRDSRTTVMICAVLGSRTTVKTRNGKRYEGFTTGFSADGDIALSDPKLSEENMQDASLPGIVIPRDTFVMCKAAGVDFKGLAVGASDFTDSGITSRLNGNSEAAMKVLQPWDDDGAEVPATLMLDENMKGWEPTDMFQTNHEKFNVKSSYSEDLDGYTTPKVAPNSEGYEERERLATMAAREIEGSDIYRARIAKEDDAELSEEAKFASVNDAANNARSNDGHSSGGKNTYTIPALRDGDQNIRNNNASGRSHGRNQQRQNSPYSSSPATNPSSNTSTHQSVHNARHLNNHYHQGPPPPVRNQIPPHQRQQQQQSAPTNNGTHIHHHHPPAPHPMQQQQHAPIAQSQPPMQSQLQQRASTHQQLVSTTSKMHPNAPAPVPGKPLAKGPHPLQSSVAPAKVPAPLVSQQQGAVPSSRPPPATQHINGAVSMPPRLPESSALPTASMADSTAQPVAGATPAAVSSSQPAAPQDRRSGRPVENNPGEARTKVNKQLQEFKKNFVLENPTTGTEVSETVADHSSSSGMSSSSPLSLTSSSPSATTESASSSSEPQSATPSKTSEKSEESSSSGGTLSKLNPLAKEFTPAMKMPGEAQSPSPQQRASPQVVPQMMAAYPTSPMYGYVPGLSPGMVSIPPQNKRGSVPVGRMSDLAAHHVTGQPLLATSPQMVYMQPNQSGGYQVLNLGNPGTRMVTPGSFPMPQTGQPSPMDPANPQAQPQPVFLTGQQQAMPGPMPAHLTQHPQPAHAQALPNPSPNPTAQPTHVPNPAPSPVQHQSQQQTAQQYGGQPISHHISQGPPQTANPQASHFPPMSIHHGIPTMSRASMSGQHGMAAQSGHQAASISYPMSTPSHSYHNANPAQYSITPAPQPQTSQNSNPSSGHQPHYVVMPHPPPHQHMQQQHHGQAYTTTGIQFPSGHNIVQGPSQIPPSHTPNQGTHMLHPGIPGNPGMFMQVQQFPHQQ